jgi:hypothetical protein
LLYEEPGIEHGFAADGVLHPEQEFLSINECNAFIAGAATLRKTSTCAAIEPGRRK